MSDLQMVKPGMEIVGADGVHVGLAGRVEGDRLILANRDSGEDGSGTPPVRDPATDHYLPASLVARVEDGKVILTVEAARAAVMDALGE